MRWIVLFCLLFANINSGILFSEEINRFSDNSLTYPPAELPVKVRTGFYLLNFTEVNEKNETFLADVYLSFRWNDPRLAFSSDKPQVYQEDAAKDKLTTIWRPQIEFINGVDPIYNNRTLFIHPDGEVEYHISVTSHFYTGFNFKRFPFDEQVLKIRLDSFSWNKNIVVFVPSTDNSRMYDQSNISSLEEYILDISETEEVFISGPVVELFEKTDEFSSYVVSITIKRKAGYFFFQVFFPIFLVIGMSCMVFFGYKEPFLDKIMINLTAFLVILAAKFTINLNLPEIGYLTMIDKTFLASYVCIGLTVIVDVLQKYWSESHEIWAKRVNNYARWSIFLLFIFSFVLIYFLS